MGKEQMGVGGWNDSSFLVSIVCSQKSAEKCSRRNQDVEEQYDKGSFAKNLGTVMTC